MKILKQTTDELITEDNGGSYFFAALFVLIGLGGVYYYFTAHESSIIALIIPAIFALAGINMILVKTTFTVDINKTTGKIGYNKKSIIKNQSAEFNIADAKAVEFREGSRIVTNNNNNQTQGFSFNNSGNTQVQMHQTVLVMKNGDELALEAVKDNNSGFTVMGVQPGILLGGRGKMFAVSNEVATFLGVPFNDVNGGMM